MAPVSCLLRPFFKNTIFSKMALNRCQKWKISNFFFILGKDFIGLFNGILHFFRFSLVSKLQNTTFSKIAQKINKSWKFQIFFCILGNHFIGLFNGILHFFIILVYPEKLKEMLLLLNFICPPLYLIHCVLIDIIW